MPQTKQLRNSAKNDPCLVPGFHLYTKIWVRSMIGLLKIHRRFTNEDKRKFETHSRWLLQLVWGREQGSRRCFADVTNRGQITFATQAIIYISKLKLCFLRKKKTAGKPQVVAVVINWFQLIFSKWHQCNSVTCGRNFPAKHWYRVRYKTKKCLLYSWLTT